MNEKRQAKATERDGHAKGGARDVGQRAGRSEEPFSQVPRERKQARACLRRHTKRFAVQCLASRSLASAAVILNTMAAKQMTERDRCFVFMCAKVFGEAVSLGGRSSTAWSLSGRSVAPTWAT